MKESAFRHWSTPIGEPLADVAVARSQEASTKPLYSVEQTECYTAMNFRLLSILDVTFNTTGEDDMVWAANGEDYFVGYHGLSRGRFQVNWMTGSATGAASAIANDREADVDGNEETSGAGLFRSILWSVMASGIAIALLGGSAYVI